MSTKNLTGAEATGTIAGSTSASTTAGTGGAAGKRAPRPLAVRGRLVRGEVTADCPRLEDGDERKLAIVEAISIATGQDLLGLGAAACGNVLLVAGEDTWAESLATAAHHLNYSLPRSLYHHPVEHNGRLVSRSDDGRLEVNAEVKRWCGEWGIRTVIICGLWDCTGVHAHEASAELFETLQAFARETNTAVWVLDGSGDAATFAAHTRDTVSEIERRARVLAAAWDIYSLRDRRAGRFECWEPLPLCRSAAEARAQGEHAYFTGEPCKHGHVTIRYTKKNKCAECAEAELDRCLATALRLTASRIGFDLDRGDAFDHTFEMKNRASDTLSFLQERHRLGSSAINDPTLVTTTGVVVQLPRPAALRR